MEVARLLEHEINIDSEWYQLQSEGVPEVNIVRILEDKYRIHSRKKAFECLCCQQPVSLVLRHDSPHFRHQGDPCPSAENYQRYTTNVRSNEDESKHRAGRAILRTYLEGQLRPHHVIVEDGYMCKSSLKIVPDFLLTFPDGTIWSVDYVTGARQDESYNNYIKKRREAYQAAGFKPFFFIDSSWLAELPEQPAISLYLAENQMKSQNSMDATWTEFLGEFISVFGPQLVLREWFGISSILYPIWEVFSLTYVDPQARTAEIQRFVPATNKFGLYVHRAKITLERAASLNEEKTNFLWFHPHEPDEMQKVMSRLVMAHEAKLAKQQAEESARREEMEKERIRQEKLRMERAVQIHGKNDRSEKVFNLEGDMNILVAKLAEGTITEGEAMALYNRLQANKSHLSRTSLQNLGDYARTMMGSVRKPNPIPDELRGILIQICFL